MGRIEDSQSSVCITCDGSYMNGKIVELKRIMDEALKRSPTVEHVIVFSAPGTMCRWSKAVTTGGTS